MRILKHGTERLYVGACGCCGCEFECGLSDGAFPDGSGWQITCPECRKAVKLTAKDGAGLPDGVKVYPPPGVTVLGSTPRLTAYPRHRPDRPTCDRYADQMGCECSECRRYYSQVHGHPLSEPLQEVH